MADKVVIEAEVKSNIKSVSKETKELTNEFGAFGITIGGVKDKFKDMGKIMMNGLKQVALQAKLAGVGFKKMFSGNIIGGAKTLFGVIKTGIAATGIGALLIGFTSLATFFTKTKKGAEILEVAFAGLGAAMSVIVDRVSKFGGAIVKLFQGDAKGALQDVKGAFTGIGEEIANDTKQAIALKEAFQDLRDSERDLNVETAQRRSEIEALKLIAEDVSKSEQVRLKAAKDAFAIENKLLADRVANAEEAVRIQKEQNKINQSMDEDLDALAQKEIDLANIKAESTTKQIELNNKINAIQAEVAAKQQEIRDADKVEIVEMTNLFEQNINKRIELLGELAKAEEINFEKKKTIELSLQELSEKRIEWDAMTQNERLNLTKNTLNDLTKIAGEETEAGKALAITAATIDTYQSAQASYKSLAGIPVIGPALGGVAAAAAVAMGLKNIAAIKGANSSGGGGGGGNISAPNTSTPAPQMMSGAFDLTGGIAPEPVQAFVLTDSMTNSQNQLANIRRRATI